MPTDARQASEGSDLNVDEKYIFELVKQLQLEAAKPEHGAMRLDAIVLTNTKLIDKINTELFGGSVVARDNPVNQRRSVLHVGFAARELRAPVDPAFFDAVESLPPDLFESQEILLLPDELTGASSSSGVGGSSVVSDPGNVRPNPITLDLNNCLSNIVDPIMAISRLQSPTTADINALLDDFNRGRDFVVDWVEGDHNQYEVRLTCQQHLVDTIDIGPFLSHAPFTTNGPLPVDFAFDISSTFVVGWDRRAEITGVENKLYFRIEDFDISGGADASNINFQAQFGFVNLGIVGGTISASLQSTTATSQFTLAQAESGIAQFARGLRQNMQLPLDIRLPMTLTIADHIIPIDSPIRPLLAFHDDNILDGIFPTPPSPPPGMAGGMPSGEGEGPDGPLTGFPLPAGFSTENFEQLLSFDHLSAVGMNLVIDQVFKLLDSLENSSLMDEQIPLTNKRFGEVLSFSTSFKERVRDSLFDDNGAPTFNSAQALAELLQDLGSFTFTPKTANTPDLLAYTFDFEKTFAPLDTSVNLDLISGTAAEIADIAVTAQSVSINAAVGLSFTLAIDLSELGLASGITPATTISVITDKKLKRLDADKQWDKVNTNGSTADIIVHLKDGTQIEVDLSSLNKDSTLQAVVELLNNRVKPGFASYDADKQSIILRDTTLPAGPDAKFTVKRAGGSGLGMLLGIVNTDTDRDGIIESEPLHGESLLDKVSIRDAELTGNLGAQFSELDATAKFMGLLDVGIVDGSGAISADLDISLVDRSSSTPNIVSLGDVVRGLNRLGDFIDIVPQASVDLDLPVTFTSPFTSPGSTDPNNLTDANPAVAVSWPTVFTSDMEQGIELNTGSLNIETVNLGQLATLPELSIENVVRALYLVIDSIEKMADNEFMSAKIPVIDKSPRELIDFAQKFRTKIEAVTTNPQAALGELLKQLKQELGLSDSAFNLRLDNTGGGLALAFDISQAFTTPDRTGDGNPDPLLIPFRFDISQLGIPGLSELVTFDGGGNLSVNASAGFSIGVGLDLSHGVPQPFLYDDRTHIEATADLDANNLEFRATLLSLGLQVGQAGPGGPDGQIKLDVDGIGGSNAPARIGLTVDNLDGDNRHYLIGGGGLGTLFADLNPDVKIGAGLNLPLNKLSYGGVAPLPLDASTPNFEANVSIDSEATQPFSFTTTSIPDFQGILDSISFGDGIDGLIAGVDGLLMLLENVLDGEVFGLELPLIGTKLQDAANFLSRVRENVVSNLRSAPNAAVTTVRQAIFDAIGPGNLNWLADLSGDGTITLDDVQLLATRLGAGGQPTAPVIVRDPLAQIDAETESIELKFRLGN
ncbi:MAG: hypothetical protein KDA51_13560, partial [Planctomycetales bacterium]|nr:hypothetical protein [Planctomycetales bacterium]